MITTGTDSFMKFTRRGGKAYKDKHKTWNDEYSIRMVGGKGYSMG